MAQFDLTRFTDGLQRRDSERILDAYAEGARLSVVDKDHPPSRPMILSGKAAIGEFWRNVCGRDMTHAIDRPVLAGEQASFVEACAYPDGARVLSSQTLKLEGGRIVDHLMVQAWDG